MGNQAEELGPYIRRVRKERNLSIVAVARACRLSSTYLSDIEKGRRGQVLESRTAARLAAALDVPVSEIAALAEGLTDTEQAAFAAYHRVLRSNARASMVLELMVQLRKAVDSVQERAKKDRTLREVAQVLETTVDSLDDCLQYASRFVARRQGDGTMFPPLRRR